MTRDKDKFRLLSLASDAFRALAAAVADRRIYAPDHPRCHESLARARTALEAFFREDPESLFLTWIRRRGQVEFRRVPVLQPGPAGERLARLLEAGAIGGLRLRHGLVADELSELISHLIARSRRGEGVGTHRSPSPPPSGEVSTYQIISEDAARELDAAGRTDWDDGRELVDLPDVVVSESATRSLFDGLRNLMRRTEVGGELDIQPITAATRKALEVLRRGTEFPASGFSTGYFDDFTFHHSVNVCLLATQVASRVVQDDHRLTNISLAALLHDVGKSHVPREILHKAGRLTGAELRCMQEHPVAGARMLLEVEGIDPVCVTAAFSHHVHDGPGSYPDTRERLDTGWVTELISVVDVFEALTAVRPYKTGLPPEKAFEIMLEMPGLKRRLPTLKMLYDSVGPYPVGTTVELDTRERGVVISHDPQRPRLPRVRLLTDSHERRLDTPVEIDLAHPDATEPRRRIVATVVCGRAGENPLEAEVRPPPERILGVRPEDDEVLMTREG